MFSHDDVNFECRTCGELKYLASNAKRIRELTTPQSQGGLGRPSCPVCGRVSIPNNGGFACIHCSSYYELPNKDRPPRLYLMPRPPVTMPAAYAWFLVLMAIDLVLAGAAFFGGWQI